MIVVWVSRWCVTLSGGDQWRSSCNAECVSVQNWWTVKQVCNIHVHYTLVHRQCSSLLAVTTVLLWLEFSRWKVACFICVMTMTTTMMITQQILSWMTANLLTLNSSKTECLLIGRKRQLSKIHDSSLTTTLLVALTFQCVTRAQEHRAAVAQDSGLHTRHAASQ